MNLETWPSYRSKVVLVTIQHVVIQIDYFNKVNVKILRSLFLPCIKSIVSQFVFEFISFCIKFKL